MTGFTDKMRGDLNLNKDIASTTLGTPNEKMIDTKAIILKMLDPVN